MLDQIKNIARQNKKQIVLTGAIIVGAVVTLVVMNELAKEDASEECSLGSSEMDVAYEELVAQEKSE